MTIAMVAGVGMLAPVVVIDVLLSLGASATLPWLEQASGPAMMLGMLAAMLLRRERYLGGRTSVDAPPRKRSRTASGHIWQS